MSRVTMPRVAYHNCELCSHIAEYYFNEYGTTEPCDYCGAAPIHLNKVNVTKAVN